MSAAHIIPFPTEGEEHLHTEQAPPRNEGAPLHAEGQLITTVVVTPTQSEEWVPHLSTRYPGAFASFARWASAERAGDDNLIVR